MAKITLNDVGTLDSYTTATATINSNSAAIETAIENTLSRDGTSPNQMVSNFDMNSHQILNLPAPATAGSPVRLQDVQTGGTITNIPVGGTTGQVLSKTSNANYAIGWGNSVTSVGLALPNDFTITNSPVTSTGTLTGSWVLSPTGTGSVVRANSPTLVTPALGTPTSGVATNLTGTAAGLTAGNVTTNANLTGPITSTGNATAIASQTGTGTKFVVDTSPTLVTPVLGVATATSVNKVALTPPATAATLTIANNKTLTSNNSLTLVGTDATTLTFQGTDTYVGRATTDTLTNKTFDSTGTGNSLKVGAVPVFVGQFPGEPTTGSANAGNIGEYVESVVLVGSAVSLVTNVSKTVTSISLTAGDWDVVGHVYFNFAATTNVTGAISSISGTTNTIDGTPGKVYQFLTPAFVPGISAFSGPIPPYRLSLSGTTTVFLIANCSFTVSTCTANGIIRARRAR